MHTQILVIYPEQVLLDDIMYWYQEIDKYPNEKMADERCQFILEIPEKEIPDTLEKIRETLDESRVKYLDMIQYRSNHSIKQFEEKYNTRYHPELFEWYTMKCDALEEYHQIKDLPITDPRQIKWIKHQSMWGDGIREAEIYIEGKGYGFFDNPYGIWDYYDIVNDHRFPSDVHFLVSKNGTKDNTMRLNDLHVNKTVDNIHNFSRVWEHIIFCEKDPADTRIYTIDDIRFDHEWNKHCLVDDLKKQLHTLSEDYPYDEYIVTAIDTHW